MSQPLFRLARLARRLGADASGNILMLMGFAILPLTFVVGMAVDYSRAEKLQTKLNAAADAAVLAAVDYSMMQQSDANAQAAAYAMFKSQVQGLSGLIIDLPSDYHLTYTPAGALNNGRTITVTYTAKSQNIFGGILGSPTLPITGSSKATAAVAPNINFYLMLDTSPSMLLPSTSAGLANIRAATSTSHLANGCDFACHNQNPHNDNIYVQNTSGQDIWLDKTGAAHAVSLVFANGDVCTANCGTSTRTEPRNAVIVGNITDVGSQYADGVWLTQNYSTLYSGGGTIDLRVNDETAAAQQLIPFAQNQAALNQVTYQIQMFGFGYGSPTALTSSMTNVNNLSASSVPDLLAMQPLWYKNNCITAINCINDEATSFQTMLGYMNTLMPNPGTGQSSTSPKEVLFLVTDGMDDEATPVSPLGSNGNNISGTRWVGGLAQSEINTCTAIKNRGIMIAVLYTQYLPDALTGDSWSQSYVANYVKNVQPALVSCASTASDGTPLVYTVTTDQNIASALQALFALAVEASHLLR
ncbi:MAG: hypothetical protein KGK11_12660 [Sphingomonadales bacterium]|nr:hypothetical protein [Sphingomonadales bacterium]